MTVTETLKEVTFEFESNTGQVLLNIETLKNIEIELGHTSEDVVNTDMLDLSSMGITFRDISHKILLLSDLLHYTMKDLTKAHEHTHLIKSAYFDLIIREKDIKKADAGNID